MGVSAVPENLRISLSANKLVFSHLLSIGLPRPHRENTLKLPRSQMSLPTIFSTCRPRADVLGGTVRDDEFMADLSRVVTGTAPSDYLDPAAFFAKSYPTRGMKELLKAVCLRLSGTGGEVSAIIRLV